MQPFKKLLQKGIISKHQMKVIAIYSLSEDYYSLPDADLSILRLKEFNKQL